MVKQKTSPSELLCLLLAMAALRSAVVVPSIGSGSCNEGTYFDQSTFTCLTCPAGSFKTNQDRACSCSEEKSSRPKSTPVEVCESCTTFDTNPTQDCSYETATKPVCDKGFGLAYPTPRKGYSTKKCLPCNPDLNSTSCVCLDGEVWSYPGYCLNDTVVTNNLIGSTQSNFADCYLAQVASTHPDTNPLFGHHQKQEGVLALGEPLHDVWIQRRLPCLLRLQNTRKQPAHL